MQHVLLPDFIFYTGYNHEEKNDNSSLFNNKPIFTLLTHIPSDKRV